MTIARPLSILLLANAPRGAASTIHDHVGSFVRYSRHRVDILDPRRLEEHPLDLDVFDVIVIHYTIHPNSDALVAPWLREKLRTFQGLKVQFAQDEYRRIDERTSAMRDLEIDVLFSAVPEAEVGKVYGSRLDRTEIMETLTGFVPEGLGRATRRPLSRRPTEVGYRGRVVPWWLGALGQEKVEIARQFLARSAVRGVACNIAWNEHDRLYGRRWIRFLSTCRCTLVTESGASIVDHDGSIEDRTEAYLDEHPEATFDEVHAAVLAPFEGNATINVVSPRVFEAAALRTALVAFPGEYSHVIRPDEHYIALEKDFSNFDEVVERIRDVSAVQAMIERTHDDLVRSGRYSYQAFVRHFDDVVSQCASGKGIHGRESERRRVRGRRRRLPTAPRVDPRRTALRRTLATSRLIATDRDLVRLLAAYVFDAELRRRVPLRRLREDLLRLGVIRRAHSGQSVTRTPFSIRPAFVALNGTLVLISQSEGAARYATGSAPVQEAFARGRVREIVWNHRAIGRSFRYLPAFGGRLHIRVGYYGLNGLHEFGALAAIAERHPETTWRALSRLTARPRVYRPAPATDALVRLLPRSLGKRVLQGARRRRREFRYAKSVSQWLLRAVRRPHRRMARGLRPLWKRVRRNIRTSRRVALRAARSPLRLGLRTLLAYSCAREILRHPALRRLAVIALRRSALRSDLMRLAVLRGLDDGTLVAAGEPFQLSIGSEGGSLTLLSSKGEPSWDGSSADRVADAFRTGGVSEVVWDHSALGPHVQLLLPLVLVRRRVSYPVGGYDAAGIYRFVQLSELARENPDLVLAAFGPILRAPPALSTTMTHYNNAS